MISPTTRHTSPAASRTGRSAAALPNDPGLDEILADPDLSSTAKAIITVMVKNWAWFKDHCWPCDRTLAAKVGKSVGQVQRCLQELEQTGRIAREKTDAVPNGRRIWLLWRRLGGRAGAQREFARARSAPAAPARSERIVVVNEGREREIPPASRPRPEAAPTATGVPDPAASPPAASSADEPATPPAPSPTPQEPLGTLPEPEMDIPPLQAFSEPAEGQSGDSAPLPVPADPVHPSVVPDLGAIGRPATPEPAPVTSRIPRIGAPSPPPRLVGNAPRRKKLGLTLEELVKVVGETADPILAAELARRTAPPAPPEPPPQALPTAELLGKLPGRHDWIAAATHRLAEATGDFQPASWSFFQKAVEAVVTRSVPPGVLLDCHRQATGPKAKSPGRVFVTAWRRETQLRR